MRVEKITSCFCAVALACSIAVQGQSVDSIGGRLMGFPPKLLERIQSKTAHLDQQLTCQSQKYLTRMARQERRLKKKMYKMDSSSAKKFFGNTELRYSALSQNIGADTGRENMKLQGAYLAYVDSMKTSLSFLQQESSLTAGMTAKLQGAAAEFRQLEARMQDAAEIKQFIQQRKEQIQQYLQRYTHLPSGVANVFNDYKTRSYYYSQQVQSYKDELNDPDKLLKRGLQVLNRIPAYGSFVKKNSMLASLFNIPSSGDPVPSGALQGMPSRDQVLQAIRGSSNIAGTGADPAAGLQQNINAAQDQLGELRSKLSASGGGTDLDIPDFKPNGQKTKPFFHRLEFGINLQSAPSTNYFPTTTDIGVSLGFKLNDKNVAGIGASYKIGWGSDIKHIKMSGEGVGLRSFVDIHIDKSFFASGGFEYNYQRPFDIQRFPGKLDSWQRSGLVGVSKIVSMKGRTLKNAKLQLLWDFLSFSQVPRAPSLKFRVGYSF